MSDSKWMASVCGVDESCLVLPGEVSDVVYSSTCSARFSGLLLVLNPAKKLESKLFVVSVSLVSNVNGELFTGPELFLPNANGELFLIPESAVAFSVADV